ncbi:MAG: metallophosphoesterase [Candidatus Bathyarchaeia archaeon]
MSIRRVFVSDVHMSPGLSLGSLQGCYDWFNLDESLKFEKFLAYLIDDDSIQEVIFLGDIMDDWVYPIEIQPPKYDKIANATHIIKIMANLRTLAQRKKGNITYVMGNHDMTLIKGQFNNFRQSVFAGIKFQEFYETTDGIYAEHGHQYTMYNAVDPKHELPLGHYISRLAATIAQRKQRHYTSSDIEGRFSVVGNFEQDEKKFIGPKGLIQDPLVNAPLSFLANELGNVNSDTPITMVNDGVITLREVRQQYAQLGIDWIKRHGLLDGLRSIWREAVGLDGVASKIATKRSKKVVIFGHTHKKENSFVIPVGSVDPVAIYANCGAWCLNIELTYIIDEYDESSETHTVTLKYWDKTAPDEVNKIQFSQKKM